MPVIGEGIQPRDKKFHQFKFIVMKKLFLILTLVTMSAISYSQAMTNAQYMTLCYDRADECLPIIEALDADLAHYEYLRDRAAEEYNRCRFYLDRGCMNPFMQVSFERARRLNEEYSIIADRIRTNLMIVNTFYHYCISEAERVSNYDPSEAAPYVSNRVTTAKEIRNI